MSKVAVSLCRQSQPSQVSFVSKSNRGIDTMCRFGTRDGDGVTPKKGRAGSGTDQLSLVMAVGYFARVVRADRQRRSSPCLRSGNTNV